MRHPSQTIRRFFSIRLLLAALWVLTITAPPAAAQAKAWQPQNTWVFVVGALEWKHTDSFGPFPQKNRRDAQLVSFFRREGVPPAQLLYLQDAQATTARIQRDLASQLARTKEGDLLFLYYCGHGYKRGDETYFASYDAGDQGNPGWAVASIPAMIERYFKGSRALLAADCCDSGALAEAVKTDRGHISYAVLTSATSGELSTGNWTFTECLLAGLRGQAYIDTDGNRQITLGELAHEVEEDMSFAEGQAASFATTGDFTPQTVLTRAGEKVDPRIGERVEVEWAGKWYHARIINAGNGLLRVHYYGWDETDDEWVKPDRIRRSKPASYTVGETVEVQWKGRWYRARILKSRGSAYFVHYLDYGAEWDEWAPTARIRRPGA